GGALSLRHPRALRDLDTLPHPRRLLRALCLVPSGAPARPGRPLETYPAAHPDHHRIFSPGAAYLPQPLAPVGEPGILEDARRRLPLAPRDPPHSLRQGEVLHLQRGLLLASVARNRGQAAAGSEAGDLVIAIGNGRLLFFDRLSGL